MNDAGLTFHPMGGAPATISPPPAVEIPSGVEVYRFTINGQSFKLAFAKELCVDSMSGMPYPASVSVEVGESRSEGCGGEPESLLRGEWAVNYVDGKPIVAIAEFPSHRLAALSGVGVTVISRTGRALPPLAP